MRRGRPALRLLLATLLVVGLRPGMPARLSTDSRVHVVVDEGGSVTLRTPAAEFVVGRGGCIEARLLVGGRPLSLDESGASGGCASSVTVDGREAPGLALEFGRARVVDVAASAGGPGRRVEIPARLASGDLALIEATLALEVRDSSPNAAASILSYRNVGMRAVTLDLVSVPERRLQTPADPGSASPGLWSFHGSSERVGQGEVVPVTPGFARSNVMGVPGRGDVGGGIPVIAFWSATVGTALGHIEPVSRALSMPVDVDTGGRVRATVRLEPRERLDPGEAFSTPRLFHAVFAGDYYEALEIYWRLLEGQGRSLPRPPSGSYEPSWCSWGYGEDVTPDRMLGVLPKLRDLGIRWAVLDDRWFDAFGDWRPRGDTFPEGSIQRLVAAYHERGVRLQIWWVPLAVETGRVLPRGTRQRNAEAGTQHPDWLVLDQAGRPARTTRGLSVFCPAVREVREYHRRLVERFIGDWGFDGHKLDAVFTVPPCYNPRHHHSSPDDSLSALGALYEELLTATRALKPDALVQICPCGTAPHHAWLPFLTQAVAADPWGSAQRRQRIKMYKALLGPSAAVSGDHVELAEFSSIHGGQRALGRDFASTIGLGGVPATRFVWPDAAPSTQDVFLTADKDALWTKWLKLYEKTRLSDGTFRNLYLHGFDRPEGYGIEKDGRMYYAFFSPDPGEVFDGTLELRGLGPGRHRVEDYVSGRSLGVVEGPRDRLQARFKGHLLLVASTEG